MSENLPIVPMRSSVLLPGVSLPISAGRPATLRAIEAAMRGDRRVFAVAQRQDVEEVNPDALYTIGTIATIGSVQRGIGGLRLVLEGQARATAVRIAPKAGYLEAAVAVAQEQRPLDERDPAFRAMYREARERAAELARKLGLPDEATAELLAEVTDPGRLADLVAAHLELPFTERQALLETLPVEDRLRRVLVHLQRQIDVLSAQEEIQSKVKEELGGRQKEVYLREQLKAIQKELGEGEGAADEELKELKAKLDALPLPAEARKEVDREWARLVRVGRESMESQVIRTYLENVAELPWGARTGDHLDVKEAARVLDEDHYGLGDVKDRILEFLGRAPSCPSSARRRTRRVRRRVRRRARRRARSRPTRRGRGGGGSSCSPARRASARRRSRSRSRARWAASTCGSRSAARATRPTSAATAARTSARCPGGSSRA